LIFIKSINYIIYTLSSSERIHVVLWHSKKVLILVLLSTVTTLSIVLDQQNETSNIMEHQRSP